jgi:phosphatidylinositol 3-kinase
MRYLIQQWTDQMNTTEFMCYLPSILMNMLFYSQFEDIRNDMEVFLLRRAIMSDEISHYLFWILTQTINGLKIWYVGANQWVTSLRQKLVDMLSADSCQTLQYGYDFTHNLIQIVMSYPNNRIHAIRDFLHQHAHTPDNIAFTLPVNIHRTIRRIDIDRIHILESKTEPIVIPCICDTSDNYTILLKKEDVRREEMMMRMLRLFDYYLKTEEGLDLYIRTYPILPISNQYGYIEFIPKSHTLFSIREQYRFSIQNFILERNPTLSIADFRDRFTKSCAAFCVFTYFMGVGDRHLDNIMISEEDGTLFHIDYAYILGHDPKPIHPFARLTPEMIDAMGGTSSIYYDQFCKYCESAVHCIRRHQNMFHILLLYGCMIDNRITPEQIDYFIASRFMPNQTSHEVYRLFMKMLEDTNETYGIHLMDFIHKQYKRSNSISSSSASEPGIVGDMSALTTVGLSSSFEMITVAQPVTPPVTHPGTQPSMQVMRPVSRVAHTHTDNYANQLTVQLADTVNSVASTVSRIVPVAMSSWSNILRKASSYR